jgi:hypothetical protein
MNTINSLLVPMERLDGDHVGTLRTKRDEEVETLLGGVGARDLNIYS